MIQQLRPCESAKRLEKYDSWDTMHQVQTCYAKRTFTEDEDVMTLYESLCGDSYSAKWLVNW